MLLRKFLGRMEKSKLGGSCRSMTAIQADLFLAVRPRQQPGISTGLVWRQDADDLNDDQRVSEAGLILDDIFSDKMP